MTASAEFRPHGLYYPYFHIRNESWIKVAALYWPKIIRIVPDQYPVRDSDTVRALADNFIVLRPPGQSVHAARRRFLELINNYGDDLRARFRVTKLLEDDPYLGRLAGVHISEIGGGWYLDILEYHQLGIPGYIIHPAMSKLAPISNGIDGRPINRRWQSKLPTERELHNWVLMHPALVGIYKGMLAEDFAVSNMLQPTTDQDSAYAVTNNWTTDRIAAALLDGADQPAHLAPGELPEVLGFLALGLVVPADLDRVPVAQIIDIRERYGAEFFSFGQAVDQVAASIAELPDIRDQKMLEDYLRQVVAVRFAQPLDDLREKMKRLTGDAVTMSIKVKTQLPAGAALAGGAWLSGHPLLAGTSAVAIGLMAVRGGIRQKRDDVLKSAPAASYLLHTQRRLQPKSLLDSTFRQLARIIGTSTA